MLDSEAAVLRVKLEEAERLLLKSQRYNTQLKRRLMQRQNIIEFREKEISELRKALRLDELRG